MGFVEADRGSRSAITPIAEWHQGSDEAVPTPQREDADMRMTRWDFEPGAVTQQNTHGSIDVGVLLTEVVMTVDASRGGINGVATALVASARLAHSSCDIPRV